ncbi:MAG: 50S ribosomal protein L30 [Alistipes sp.]|jgi:large subunit ribosomal protein L30|nr:50S ribosomal protein L30 [Alistipes sp.]
MATLKITQIKSRIGATEQQCKNLDALGLRKINRTVEHSDSAIILGMVEKVKHLVKVEVVEEKKAAKKATKKVAAPKAEETVSETTNKEE